MTAESKITVVTQVAKRFQLVTLADWQTEAGEPVCVRCSEVAAEDCWRVLGILPGERPQLGIPDDADQETALAQTKRILEVSADMIELGTSLADPDGAEVRPAFHFGDGQRRHELSLDGAKLSDTDLMQLSVAILRCSGYLGGAADASFLRAQRSRLRERDGALEVRPGDGADAQAGAP